MKITSYPLQKGQWYKEKTEKKWVVWHGTSGRTSMTPANGKPGKATTSIDSWNNDQLHVGAPWLVDRDGTIYQTFDDNEWIYHLGLKGTEGFYDRASVAIEFANELGLNLDGDKLHAFGYNTPNTLYTGDYFIQQWRDHEYWARLEEIQIDAGIELTLDICSRFGIKPRFFCPSTVYSHPKCFKESSIICHSNCRKDKEDILLEEWVWDRIRKAGIEIAG